MKPGLRSRAPGWPAAVAAALLLPMAAAIADPAPVPLRRAAVSDTLLAAEDDGELYLELLVAEGESALSLALSYGTGKSAAPLLRAANGGNEPAPGRFYRLPLGLLKDEFRRTALAALYPDELPRAPLEYGKDGLGSYAAYRLRGGEALYSKVVVRFTGRVDVEEVNELAKALAERSGIRDVREIPVGFPVKIPMELLLPEYLPPGDPVRQEYEQAVAAAARHGLEAPARRLSGVHVILDAGHGGKDPGAIVRGVYEDEHAYDVMCRIARLLKQNTEAEVYTTIIDRSSRFRSLDGLIHPDTDESLVRGRIVRTAKGDLSLDGDAIFNLRSDGATRRGVNDRFNLANERMDELRKQGINPQNVVFLSLHADALHASLRGAMIYVPGVEKAHYLPRGISPDQREEAIGLSRRLARGILARLRDGSLEIHPNPAIRDRVIRGRRQYIPAVVRETTIPHALLIEVGNLNNSQDRRLLVKSDFRERFAGAVVEALVEYYGLPDGSPPAEVARLN